MEKIVVLSYVDYCVYWYSYEALVKLFGGDIGNRFHVNFLVYAHWFMSIIISHMKDHYISVDQARYAISTVAKYLEPATVKTSIKFYTTNFTSYVIFTKADAYTSD